MQLVTEPSRMLRRALGRSRDVRSADLAVVAMDGRVFLAAVDGHWRIPIDEELVTDLTKAIGELAAKK